MSKNGWVYNRRPEPLENVLMVINEFGNEDYEQVVGYYEPADDEDLDVICVRSEVFPADILVAWRDLPIFK